MRAIHVSDTTVRNAYLDMLRECPDQDKVNQLFVASIDNLNTNHINQVEVIQQMIVFASKRWSIPVECYLPPK